jgi:predicted ATP-grasp superfamily ATP-dependent carboligase
VEQKGGYAARSRAVGGLVFHPDPAQDRERFVESIADAAERLSVAAVLPGNEKALLALSQNLEAFPPSVVVGTPRAEIVQRATDKRLLYRLASSAGLSTPPTFELRRDELASRGRDLQYPVVAKPLRSETLARDGVLHRYTARRIETAEDLRHELEPLDVDVWLVQPYLSGSISAISGFVWEGEIVCAAHQDMHRIWPPGCGHTSYAETVAANPELEKRVAHLLRTLGWNGIFQFEFIGGEGQEYYLMDFNPRFYLSLALTVAAGHNLPAIWVDYLLGLRPAIAPYRVGVRYRNEEKDFRVLLYQVLATSERWSALKSFRPRRHTVHSVFSMQDPGPVLESLAKLRRRMIGRD